jgi:hypothetical protein
METSWSSLGLYVIHIPDICTKISRSDDFNAPGRVSQEEMALVLELALYISSKTAYQCGSFEFAEEVKTTVDRIKRNCAFLNTGFVKQIEHALQSLSNQ